MVYKDWDSNPAKSPPKQRPSSERQAADESPELEIVAWSNGAPSFPESLMTRFPEGTEEHTKIAELKAKFLIEFPVSSQPVPADGQGGRIGGHCDFSVDSGKQPLDVHRVIDLAAVPAADMNLTKWLVWQLVLDASRSMSVMK